MSKRDVRLLLRKNTAQKIYQCHFDADHHVASAVRRMASQRVPVVGSLPMTVARSPDKGNGFVLLSFFFSEQPDPTISDRNAGFEIDCCVVESFRFIWARMKRYHSENRRQKFLDRPRKKF